MAEGYHVFKWSGGGDNVIVTGSFDDWKETQKMIKGEDGNFTATVDLPLDKKVMYKYVVDGKWSTDEVQRLETDASGNTNNYLLPEDIVPKGSDPEVTAPVIPADKPDEAAAPFLQSTGPTSTTAALAATVPLEEDTSAAVDVPDTSPAVDDSAAILSSAAPQSTTTALADAAPLKTETEDQAAILSSAAPESTTAALAADVPVETTTDDAPVAASALPSHVAPTPGNDDVPGGFPDTPAREEPEAEAVKIDPIPASETPGNPINLAPGESIPPSTAGVTDNVKLDEDSYNHPDASNLGVGATAAAGLAAVTGAVATAYHNIVDDGEKSAEGNKEGEEEKEVNEIPVPEVIKNLIPESALPITVPGVGKITTEKSEADTTDEAAKEAEAVPEAAVVKEVEPTPAATEVAEVAEVQKEDVPAAPVEVLPVVPETAPLAPASTEVTSDVVAPTPVAAPEPVPELAQEKVLPLIEDDTAKPAEVSKPVEETAPVADKPAEEKPAEPTATPSEPAIAPAEPAATPVVATEATPSTTTAATDSKEEGKDKKKKKKRISMLFQKVKHAFHAD